MMQANTWKTKGGGRRSWEKQMKIHFKITYVTGYAILPHELIEILIQFSYESF